MIEIGVESLVQGVAKLNDNNLDAIWAQFLSNSNSVDCRLDILKYEFIQEFIILNRVKTKKIVYIHVLSLISLWDCNFIL